MVKAGQRVYLRASPHNAGTIAKITPVCFEVVYDNPLRKPRQPRSRYRYPLGALERFAAGRPAPQD